MKAAAHYALQGEQNTSTLKSKEPKQDFGLTRIDSRTGKSRSDLQSLKTITKRKANKWQWLEQ
jgi:hypothetical protein